VSEEKKLSKLTLKLYIELENYVEKYTVRKFRAQSIYFVFQAGLHKNGRFDSFSSQTMQKGADTIQEANRDEQETCHTNLIKRQKGVRKLFDEKML